MILNYVTHNEVMKYWRIECISTNPNASGNFVFKGKTLDGALKSAKKYCNEYNKREEKKGFKMSVGNVLFECDYYGREVR